MIWHGTDGSDGLESGVHLRWQFDPRLGFPLEGFYLYRRSSCSRTICTEFGDFFPPTSTKKGEDLPYEYIVRDGEKEYKIIISSPDGKGEITRIVGAEETVSFSYLGIEPPIEFHFPNGTYAVEIYIIQAHNVKIIPKADGTEIDTSSSIADLYVPSDDSYSYSIRFPTLSKNSILMLDKIEQNDVSVPTYLYVPKICFRVCDDCEKSWDGPINAKCGFGLPINILHAQKVPVEEEKTHKEISAERKMLSSVSPERTPHTLNPSKNLLRASKEATNPSKCVRFSEQTAGSTLPNPYVSGQARFEAKGQSRIRVTKVLNTNGISLQSELAVRILPSSEQIEAKIVHPGGGVRVEAYSDNGDLVDSKSTGKLTKDSVHPILLRKEGSKISKVIFKAQRGPAFLLEFCYYSEQKDPEWNIAACRLPKDKWQQFQGEPFEDLKGILALMVEGAKDAPMGWRMINYKNEPSMVLASPEVASAEVEDGQETSSPPEPPPEPEIEISPMDLVLMSSINPYIARILGLCWVDTTANDGEVYDYKIVANWPKGTLWNLENIVDFEKEIVGKKFFHVFRHEDFVFMDSGDARFVDDSVPSTFSRAKKGLHSQSWENITHIIKIHCTKPVKELQLFIKHQGQQQSVTLEAFHNNTLVDSSTLPKPEGVLAVHYQQNIDYVQLKSKDVIIYKICWNAEYIPHGQQSFTLCGVKKGVPRPLETPTGLKLFPLPGMTKTRADGSLEDHRLAAGLIWDIPKNAEGKLLAANAPIMYHVQRRTPLGDIKWLTEDSPVTVVAESFEKDPPLWPKAWPDQRMFYIDAASSPGMYNYCISAVDIFGRISEYTNWASVDLKRAVPPPPPSDVEAKLLDPSDPSLTGNEKDWVTSNKKVGLKVRWKWTEPLRRQAPDVNAFNIYFQPGWLNVIQGEIEADPVENGAGMLELKTNYISNITPAVPDNVFAAEKMLMNLTNYKIESSKRDGTKTKTTGKFIFSIKKPIPRPGDFSSSDFGTFWITKVVEIGDSSNNLEITTDYQIPRKASTESFIGQTLTIRQKQYTILSCRKDDPFAHRAIFKIPKIYPRKDDFFSIPISQQKEPADGGTFIDYRKASGWQQMLHTEPLIQLSIGEYEKQYELIIPDPPLVADGTNKVVYAQIGISSVDSEGGEGSVSSPASIIAVFREPPPPQSLEDSPNSYATIPNYYGKSSYALRWRKPATNDVRYFVYRAMDESLFSADNEIRAATDAKGKPLRSRDPSNYKDFLNNFNEDGASKIVIEIENRIIRPSPSSMDYVALTKDPLRNILLQALASLPGNEKAFAKLHEQAIHPADARFANRITDVTPGGKPEPPVDSSLLLYTDDTIDGSADNFYFYRIRTINEIGALGEFGFSSFPVYLPKVIPPVMPGMITAEAGDRQIVIHWSANLENTVVGYLVYRSDMKDKAQDIRKMILLRGNAADLYSVTAMDNPIFIDRQAEPRKEYYYRVVAVSAISENGKSFKIFSNPSPVAAAQAFDMSGPEPPIWRPALDGVAPNSKVLAWDSTNPNLRCLVQRQEVNSESTVGSIPIWANISSWLNRGVYEFEDKKRAPGVTYQYRLKVIDEEGRQNKEFNTLEVSD